MFEFWFLNLRDPQDPDGSSTFSHHGTTYDFLELCSQIATFFSPLIVGDFVTKLLTDKQKDLAFLRVIDWKIDYAIPVNPEDPRQDQTIRVVKSPR